MFKVGDRVRTIDCGNPDCYSLHRHINKVGTITELSYGGDEEISFAKVVFDDPAPVRSGGYYFNHLELIEEPKQVIPLPLP